MEKNEYTGPVFFVILTIAAFIVGIIINKDFIIIAGYIFIVMAQVAYLIVVTKSIKSDMENIKKMIANK